MIESGEIGESISEAIRNHLRFRRWSTAFMTKSALLSSTSKGWMSKRFFWSKCRLFWFLHHKNPGYGHPNIWYKPYQEQPSAISSIPKSSYRYSEERTQQAQRAKYPSQPQCAITDIVENVSWWIFKYKRKDWKTEKHQVIDQPEPPIFTSGGFSFKICVFF